MTDDDFADLWNRACAFDQPAFSTHRGDEALHVALVFHGRVMNSGLLDAVEGHHEDEEYPLSRVQDAYVFLGLTSVSAVVRRAHEERLEAVRSCGSLEDLEEHIGGTYPLDDDALDAAVRKAVDRSPQAFAPLS